MSFEVRWTVLDREWEEMQRQRHNPEYIFGSVARIDLLDGPVQLVVNGKQLFPDVLLQQIKSHWIREIERSGQPPMYPPSMADEGVFVSVIDLACGLAQVSRRLKSHEVPLGSYALFSALDSSLEIEFTHSEDGIKITSNWNRKIPDHFLLTTEADLHVGVAKFLYDFGREVQLRVPEALEWEALKDVKAGLDWSPT